MAPLPSHPRAIIFDLDGTLVDAYAAIHESLGVVLEAFGRPPVTRDETRRMVGHGLEVLVAKAVGEENVAEGVRLLIEPVLTAKGRTALSGMRRRTGDFTQDIRAVGAAAGRRRPGETEAQT